MCWYGHGGSDMSPTNLPHASSHGALLSTSQQDTRLFPHDPQTMVSPDLLSMGNCGGHDYGHGQLMCIGTQPPPMMQGTTPMGGDAGHREAMFFSPPQVPMLPSACSPTAMQAPLLSPPSTPPPIGVPVVGHSPTSDLRGLVLPKETSGAVGAQEAELM